VLGQPVTSPLAQTYCGNGSLASCRAMLLSTLSAAAAVPATTTYPGDSICGAGDQWCADSIVQSALGGITPPPISWQNRPTYQQVVSFRPTAARTSATSPREDGHRVERAVPHEPHAEQSRRRQRLHALGQQLQRQQLDQGGHGRADADAAVILHWEAAFGRAYRIEVSNDNSSWTTVFATSAGDGGTDNVTFPAVTARYVRMLGVTRGTSYGYSLWEFEVFNA
jgi:hypothetical protein